MNPRCFENENNDMNIGMNNMANNASNGCMCPPIYECPDERICERFIIHDVPHVIPIHTKMINHHIYRHTYSPCYTYQEIDTCENINCCSNGIMR